DLKLAVGILCQNPEDSNKIKLGVEESWGIFKGIIQLGLAAPQRGGPPGQPQAPPTLARDLDTIKFQSIGNVASVSMDISAQTIQDLAKIGNAQQKFPKNPPPIQPPPFNPPPFNPPPFNPPNP